MLTFLILLTLGVVLYFLIRKLRRQKAVIERLRRELKLSNYPKRDKNGMFSWLRKG